LQKLNQQKEEKSAIMKKTPSLFWKGAGIDMNEPILESVDDIKAGGRVLLSLREAQEELRIKNEMVLH
jgi:hypothetical protein